MIDRSVFYGATPDPLRGPEAATPRIYRKKSPASVAAGETIALYRVKKGERLVAASIQTGVSAAAATTSTWSIGDSTNNVGALAATTCVQTNGTLIDGAGPYVAGQGKLYATADTINLYYVTGATPGATNPSTEVTLVISQEWPATS